MPPESRQGHHEYPKPKARSYNPVLRRIHQASHEPPKPVHYRGYLCLSVHIVEATTRRMRASALLLIRIGVAKFASANCCRQDCTDQALDGKLENLRIWISYTFRIACDELIQFYILAQILLSMKAVEECGQSCKWFIRICRTRRGFTTNCHDCRTSLLSLGSLSISQVYSSKSKLVANILSWSFSRCPSSPLKYMLWGHTKYSGICLTRQTQSGDLYKSPHIASHPVSIFFGVLAERPRETNRCRYQLEADRMVVESAGPAVGSAKNA